MIEPYIFSIACNISVFVTYLSYNVPFPERTLMLSLQLPYKMII